MVGSSMLKLLYKTLLVSIMCGSLSIANMTPVYAQDTKGQVTRNSDGSLSKTDTYSFKGTKGEDDNALNVITMLAVGVIGTKLLTYKKWTTDMTVVAAASAAYIAAEIINIMNLKKQISDMNVEVTKNSNGKMDQTQIDTLQKLKESYTAVKSSIKTRKMLQMAAAAAFGIATGIAAYQRISDEGKFSSCMAAVESGQAKLASCISSGATGVGASEAGFCTSCNIQVSALATKIPETKTIADMSKTSSMLTNATITKKDLVDEAQIKTPCGGVIAAGVKTSIQGACETYKISKKANQAFGDFATTSTTFNKSSLLDNVLYAKLQPNVPMSIDSSLKQRSLLQKALDTLFPRAEAGMVSLLGLGAGAAAAFFTAEKGIGLTIDKYLFTPGGRIIAWGILTGAALLGAKASQSEMDKIDGYISKIDQILKDMNNLQQGIKANAVNEQQIKLASFNANAAQDLQLNPSAKAKTDCLAGVSSSSSSTCASLADQLKSIPGYSELPSSYQTLASQAAHLGDGLSGTNTVSAGTVTAAGNLAGNQNAIGKLVATTKEKLNDTLAKNGQPKVDFEKDEKDLLNQLKVSTAKALGNSGMSAGAFLASTGLSPFPTASASVADSTAKKPATTALANVAAPTAGSGKEKDKGFELELKDNGVNAIGVAGAGGGKEEKYDIGANDISTNTGDSIFKLISDRYIKSGYPRLLDEIPATPVKK